MTGVGSKSDNVGACSFPSSVAKLLPVLGISMSGGTSAATGMSEDAASWSATISDVCTGGKGTSAAILAPADDMSIIGGWGIILFDEPEGVRGLLISGLCWIGGKSLTGVFPKLVDWWDRLRGTGPMRSLRMVSMMIKLSIK